jgi:anti-sigma factor RsiW
MDGRHCTPYELIESLYGIGPGGEHIQECPACAAQLADMRELRRQSLDEPFSDAELADQSRRWRDRVEAGPRRPSRSVWSWRVAAVSAMVALGTVAVLPRASQRQSEVAAVEDQKLFEDAFRKVVSVEPAPFAPLENLFERSEP